MNHETPGPAEQELGGLRRKTEKTEAEVTPEAWDKLLELTKNTKKLHEILEDLAESENHQLPLWENLDIFPTRDDLMNINGFFRYHKLPYRLDVNQDRVSVEEWENDKDLFLSLYLVA